MDFKLLIPVLAVWVTLRWTDASPKPLALNENIARSVNRNGKASGLIHSPNENQIALKDLSRKDVEINSRELGMKLELQ